MKRLLVSYAISDALNRGARLPRFWRRLVSRSADLQACEQAINRLDARLRRSARNSEAGLPPALHGSIVKAVHRESSLPSPRTESSRPFLTLRWAAAGAIGAILILLAAAGLLLRPSDPSIANPALRSGEPGASLVASTATAFPGTLTLLEELSPYNPVQLTQPLASQIDAVSEDVRDTTRFLMASLP